MIHAYDEDLARNELVDTKNSQMTALTGVMLTLQSTLFTDLPVNQFLIASFWIKHTVKSMLKNKEVHENSCTWIFWKFTLLENIYVLRYIANNLIRQFFINDVRKSIIWWIIL